MRYPLKYPFRLLPIELGGTDMDEVAIRLDQLERANKRLRVVVGLFAITVAAVMLMGQIGIRNGPTILEAEQLRLKDADGRIRAALLTTQGGAVRFGVFSKDGYSKNPTPLIDLGVGSDNLPYLFFSGSDGHKRVSVVIDDTGGALGIIDRNNKIRAILKMQRDFSPSFTLRDKDGKDRAIFELDANGDPRIQLFDPYGQARGLFGLTKDIPGIFLNDEQGELVWGKIGTR